MALWVRSLTQITFSGSSSASVCWSTSSFVSGFLSVHHANIGQCIKFRALICLCTLFECRNSQVSDSYQYCPDTNQDILKVIRSCRLNNNISPFASISASNRTSVNFDHLSYLQNLVSRRNSSHKALCISRAYTSLLSNTVSQRSFFSGFIRSAHISFRTVTVGYSPSLFFRLAFSRKYSRNPSCR